MSSIGMGLALRIAAANSLKRRAFSSEPTKPPCQYPKFSFPTSQMRTSYGSGLPFLARRLPIGVVTGPLQYSTQAAASSAVAEPDFTVMYVSATDCLQVQMYAWEPVW